MRKHLPGCEREVLLGRFDANDTVVVDVAEDDDTKITFRKGAPIGEEGEFGTSEATESAVA